MLFRATVAGNIFQRKLETIFLNSDQVMIIADDIMMIGYQQDECDHDISFTRLLELQRRKISS